jgi:hypothetical protein
MNPENSQYYDEVNDTMKMKYGKFMNINVNNSGFEKFTKEQQIDRYAKHHAFWLLENATFNSGDSTEQNAVKLFIINEGIKHSMNMIQSKFDVSVQEKITDKLKLLLFDKLNKELLIEEKEDAVQQVLNEKKSKNRKKRDSKKRKKIIEQSDKIFNLILSHALKIKWYKNCIPISIILHEALNKIGIKNIIKKGFLLINEKDALWHCWIQTEYSNYDLGTAITYYNKKSIYKLSDVLPENYKRIDMNDPAEICILEGNIKMFKKYVDDGNNFWSHGEIFVVGSKQRKQFDNMLKFRNDVLTQI